MKATDKKSVKKLNISSIITIVMAVAFLGYGIFSLYEDRVAMEANAGMEDDFCVTDKEYYSTNDEIDQDYSTCLMTINNHYEAIDNFYRTHAFFSFAVSAVLFAIVINKK